MKTKTFTAILFAMLANFSAKAMADNNVNYEFETFNGTKVTICDANICYQQTDANVLESQIVPQDAEVIAPGRDFVYFEDANYYFVEDAQRSLLTIARRDVNSETVLLDGSILLSYKCKSFAKNADAGAVVLSYNREGVKAAGSNYARFTLVDQPSCKNYLQQKVSEMGGTQKEINESMMSGIKDMTYTYQTVSESTASGLKVILTLYAVPCGQKTVAIEVFRTVSPDEGTEMMIDADFENMFQSFIAIK